jgi:hypothetical protein
MSAERRKIKITKPESSIIVDTYQTEVIPETYRKRVINSNLSNSIMKKRFNKNK